MPESIQRPDIGRCFTTMSMTSAVTSGSRKVGLCLTK